MLRFKQKLHATSRAQTFVEYSVMLGAVAVLLFLMRTFLQRGTQSMIKVVCDQIGLQENAEQSFNIKEGITESSISSRSSVEMSTKMEDVGDIIYSVDEDIEMSTETITNSFKED